MPRAVPGPGPRAAGPPRAVGQRRRLDEQRDPAVAEDRGPEVAAHAGQQRAERLDHDLLRAEQAVAGHHGPPAAAGDHDPRRVAAERRRGRAQERGQVGDRQGAGRGPAWSGRPCRVMVAATVRPLPPRPAARRRPRAALDEQHLASASATGSSRWIAIPRPGSLRTSRLPPRELGVALTASRPTPRPARSVTSAAVEKPGRARTSASDPSARPLDHLGRDAAAVVRDHDLDQAAPRFRAQLEPCPAAACPPARARPAARCRARPRCAAGG